MVPRLVDISELVHRSRPLSIKEAATFAARQRRLTGAFGASAAGATQSFNNEFGGIGVLKSGLRLRHSFSYLNLPIDDDEVSDRSAPRRELRPAATRIVTSQGAALRLYLTMVAAAQATGRAGTRAQVPLPVRGNSQTVGWDVFLAAGSRDATVGRDVANVRDKKARVIANAMSTLEDARLVQLVGQHAKRGRLQGFVLLNEAGPQVPGDDPLPYTIPKDNENILKLPTGFVTNGWLNVLEDSEIAILLMVACNRDGLAVMNDDVDVRPGEVAIPGDVRLRHYGIHRDPYSSALKTLDWFGLLAVREIDRHLSDGRGNDGATNLHRLSLRVEGFEANAFDVVPHVIDTQLKRRDEPDQARRHHDGRRA